MGFGWKYVEGGDEREVRGCDMSKVCKFCGDVTKRGYEFRANGETPILVCSGCVKGIVLTVHHWKLLRGEYASNCKTWT